MPNTFFPTQFGSIPTGATYISTVTMGRTTTGTFESCGFGKQGRPDYLELLQINLSQKQVGVTPPAQKGSITLNVNDIISLATASNRSQFPTNLNFTLKEMLVCGGGATQASGIMIIASQPYPTGSIPY